MTYKKAKHTKKKQKYAARNFNREHKDRLFRFIFNNKTDLLSLYNAVNHSAYTNESDLTIYTMEDFIYMGMKNDLSFLIDCHLGIFEHQSTYNPNMPLRGFLYMASALKKYISKQNLDLYSSKQVLIPVPEYYVFYNGTRAMPDEQILKLTDAMPSDSKSRSCTQFQATMINVNANHNPDLMRKCPKLYEYAIFISRIRENMTIQQSFEAAIEKAVTDCIHDNILADILRNHKAEVTDMILDEYDEAFHIRCEKKISYEDGLEEGKRLAQETIQREKNLAQEAIQQEQLKTNILKLVLKGHSVSDIAQTLNISADFVQKYLEQENLL